MEPREKTDLMPRATIVQLVGHRDRALALAANAFEAVDMANKAARKVNPLREWSAPTLLFEHRSRYDSVGSIEQYRKQLDAAAWDYVMERTELRDLMGAKQKEDWRKRLETDPPEFTIENVVATFEGMAGQADHIFMQGLVDVFERLPRAFRSHDGFKFGDRCIMQSAVSVWGKSISWRIGNYSDAREMLNDLDRAFHRLAGEPWTTKATDVAADAMQKGESECETTMFKIRWFKNQRVHIWLKRKKVVDDANRLLGLHYGDRLGWMHLHPDERAVKEATGEKPPARDRALV